MKIQGSLNPILAGTGFCQNSKYLQERRIFGLNPILAGTGFCLLGYSLMKQTRQCPNPTLAGSGCCLLFYFFRFIIFYVSILFLLVLGSVLNGKYFYINKDLCLNPILAGTGFCPKRRKLI